MKNRIWSVCIGFILALTATPGRAQEEIRIAYFIWPPMIELEEGQDKPSGGAVDYYEQEVFPKMGVTAKWLGPYPVPRAIKLLKDNKVDMIPFLTKNPERAEIMAYPEKPFYIMKPVVCVRKHVITEALNNWDELKSLAPKIGIHYGTAFQKKLSETQTRLDLRMIREQKESNIIEYALTLLANKKLDAFIHSDKLMTDNATASLGLQDRLQCVNTPEPDRPFYAVFSLERNDLLEAYNTYFIEYK